VPKATFTDPEVGAVGLTVEEARTAGIDAFEVSQDFPKTARGVTLEATRGHLTVVVDRGRGVLAGAFIACPGAAELIHEATLAIKLAVPVDVLADTIHAFPTAARALGSLFADAAARLQ
jgi:mercuric reductase